MIDFEKYYGKLPVSIHPFTKSKKPCNKFLMIIRPDGRVEFDGCHGTAQGVAKAKELSEQIIVIKPPVGTIYKMVTIEEVPALKNKKSVNKSAVAVLNRVAEAGARFRKG